MATFVLVHGSWHGGWCWRFVAPLLRSKGHEVYTPTLTGLGQSLHLLNYGADLATHIKDITNLLFYEDLSKIILVGHSYAGMVITAVAAEVPQRLQQLVYLDAYVPFAGESEIDLWPAEERVAALDDIAAGRTLRKPPAPPILGVTDPKMVAWLAARLTPQSLTTYDRPAPLENPLGSALARKYIHCTQGPYAARMAKFAARAGTKGWEVRELATGHDAMLTAPKDLAELLCELGI